MPLLGNAQRAGNAAVVNQSRVHPPRYSPDLINDGAPSIAVVLDYCPDPAGYDAAATSGFGWVHRIADGANRVVYVGLAVGDLTADTMTATVTFNGVSMTSVGKVHSNNGVNGYIQLFRLVAPPIGMYNVAVTLSAAATSLIVNSVSFLNVDQTSPETITTLFGTGTSASLAVTGAPGDLAVVLMGAGSGLTSTNANQVWKDNRTISNGAGNLALTTEPGGRSPVTSWVLTNDDWAMIGADLLASGAPDPTFTIDTPIWIGDYETGNTSQMEPTAVNYQPSASTVVTSPTPQQGTYAGMYTVPAGTSVAGAGIDPRCEDNWGRIQDIQEGDDLWFGGWIRIDPTFVDPAVGQFCVVTQWKNEGVGSPPIELSINNDTSPCHWRIEGGFGYPTGPQHWVALDSTSNPIVRNTWVRWDFHILFSSNPAIALMNTWKDGVQVVTDYQSPTLAGTLYPSMTTYWKRGIYRSEAKTTQDIIYHDGWRAGRTAASVNFASVAFDNPGWAWAMNI